MNTRILREEWKEPKILTRALCVTHGGYMKSLIRRKSVMA